MSNAAEFCTDHDMMTSAAFAARESCIGQALAKQMVEEVSLGAREAGITEKGAAVAANGLSAQSTSRSV